MWVSQAMLRELCESGAITEDIISESEVTVRSLNKCQWSQWGHYECQRSHRGYYASEATVMKLYQHLRSKWGYNVRVRSQIEGIIWVWKATVGVLCEFQRSHSVLCDRYRPNEDSMWMSEATLNLLYECKRSSEDIVCMSGETVRYCVNVKGQIENIIWVSDPYICY